MQIKWIESVVNGRWYPVKHRNCGNVFDYMTIQHNDAYTYSVCFGSELLDVFPTLYKAKRFANDYIRMIAGVIRNEISK